MITLAAILLYLLVGLGVWRTRHPSEQWSTTAFVGTVTLWLPLYAWLLVCVLYEGMSGNGREA